jgi:hypothetical protein
MIVMRALALALALVVLPGFAQPTVVGEIKALRDRVGALEARVSALEGSAQPPVTGSATLDWAPNTEPDLAGYRVYHGTSSGVYGPAVDVGLATTYTINGLPAGTHYFTVTAYDEAGNESSRATEVSKRIQ